NARVHGPHWAQRGTVDSRSRSSAGDARDRSQCNRDGRLRIDWTAKGRERNGGRASAGALAAGRRSRASFRRRVSTAGRRRPGRSRSLQEDVGIRAEGDDRSQHRRSLFRALSRQRRPRARTRAGGRSWERGAERGVQCSRQRGSAGAGSLSGSQAVRSPRAAARRAAGRLPDRAHTFSAAVRLDAPVLVRAADHAASGQPDRNSRVVQPERHAAAAERGAALAQASRPGLNPADTQRRRGQTVVNSPRREPLRQLAGWWLVAGCWWLVAGGWWLETGSWSLG